LAMMMGDDRGFLSLVPFFRPAPSRLPPRAMSLNSPALDFL
jgi:hypothetical protein